MAFVGDKGFDSDELRALIENNGGVACIPPRSNRTSYRWFDLKFYQKRHLVENIFQRIKYWGRVATRYEKLASTSLPSLLLLAQSITSVGNKSTRPRDRGHRQGFPYQRLRPAVPGHGSPAPVAATVKAVSRGLGGRITQTLEYKISQRIRKEIEERFGWSEVVGGLRRTMYRGEDKVAACGSFSGTACNHLLMNRLAHAPPGQCQRPPRPLDP
jgi:hypothetical protein